MATIPQTAIDLILEAEGIDQPWKWPGGGSGITLGFGCDIGADPQSLDFWKGILPSEWMTRLATARGLTGRRAAEIQTRFRGINVTPSDSMKVFIAKTLPKEIKRTLAAFPGVDLMPAEVLGVMVSLVYNRGTDITDDPGSDRRKEMRHIHEILAEFKSLDAAKRKNVQKEYVLKISRRILGMKRLWVGKGLDGLLTRRDREAELVASSVTSKLPQ